MKKHAKHLLWLLPLLLIAATLVTPGKRISEYPNTATLSDADLLVAAVTNVAVPTNKNIRALNLFQQGSNGLASMTFVTNLTTSVSNSIFVAGGVVLTNQDTNRLLLQAFPVRGAAYYVGSGGNPDTNGQRIGLEWMASQNTLSFGSLMNDNGATRFIGAISNWWHPTNMGEGSIRFGSNSYVKARNSSVLGGIFNQIATNSECSAIVSGTNNWISTNAAWSFVGSGNANLIEIDSIEGFIGGGAQNEIHNAATACAIVGGLGNTIDGSGTVDAIIGGGSNNHIRGNGSSYTFMGGGFANNVQGVSTHSSIVGGDSCAIGENPGSTGSPRSFIGGGRGNWIRGNAGSLYNTLVGGFNNVVNPGPNNFLGGGWTNSIGDTSGGSVICGGVSNLIGNSSSNGLIAGGMHNTIADSTKFATIPGGVSNVVSGIYSFAIGGGLVVNTPSTVALGYADRTGKVRVEGATNATVGGLIISSTTPVASAGAAETNLITVTIPAFTLTNNQDRLIFRFTGRFAATANAKDLKVVYGATTILDTGSQVVNSGAWVIHGEIIRTGNATQSASAEFEGAGLTLFTTAASLDMAEDNANANALKMTSTAAGNGDVTNRTCTVWKYAAP